MQTIIKKPVSQFPDQELLSHLKKAAGSFVKEVNGTIQIWASSMDWFQQEWGRDTFISLPGLLLTTGRFQEAKNNIRNFTRHEKEGLLPNRIVNPDKPETIEYNTVDASLWFIQAVKKFISYTQDWDFVKEIAPALQNIMAGYERGTGYRRHNRFNRIFMDRDGLIVSPAQATWMDADPEAKDQPVTPRNGKPVEVNALWYSNLKFMEQAEVRLGNEKLAVHYRQLSEKVRSSFNQKFWFVTEENQKFWGGSGGALFDVIEGDTHQGAVRPNMIFAISHGEDLLSPNRQKSVWVAVTKDLRTPYGLRSLSPRDSHYVGKYHTEEPPIIKDRAYHQGAVWPWLIGAYVDALVRVRKNESVSPETIQSEVCEILAPLCEFIMTNPYGSLPEVFDGDAPHRPEGTRSQAWSVAELLRILVEHVGGFDGSRQN